MRESKVAVRGRVKLGHLVPFLILGACLVLLWPVIKTQDLRSLSNSWNSISPIQWGLSAIFTAISFWAVGKYDVIAHRHFDSGVASKRAHRSGIAAIGLSQTLGFGMITGSVTRWRLLPSAGPARAAQITVFVTGLFLLAMVGVVGLLTLLAPVQDGFHLPAGLALFGAVACVITTLVFPQLRLGRWSVDMPSLRAIFGAVGWTALDLVAAGLALYVLLPADTSVSFWAFLPVFCIALAAGITSGTPCGVGPFELTLLFLTGLGMSAEIPPAPLIAALGGFRLVYYVIPAMASGVYFAFGNHAKTADRRAPEPPLHLKSAPRAETGVLRQNGGRLLSLTGTGMGIWKTTQCYVGLFAPFATPDRSFFDTFAARARDNNRFAALYKCDRRTALGALKAGWKVLHIADDAVVDLSGFDLDTPPYSRLRRKIRKAQKSGVTVRAATAEDCGVMEKIDADWQTRNGHARGGAMGRFCTDYLAGQQVFVAEVDARAIAFVSMHTCDAEWTLDLMRDGAQTPDGTMYVLVHHALERAREKQADAFCLSAVPACPDTDSAFWRFLAMRTASLSHGAGLRQFKSAFAPRWTPLYMASPTRLSLLVTAFDIAREILFPRPVVTTRMVGATLAHDNDEYYEVASQEAA